MARPTSLTLRLTLLFGIVAAIVFSGFGWFIAHSIEQHFISEDVDELEIIARSVSQSLFSNSTPKNSAELNQRFNDVLVGHHGALLYITRRDGSTLFKSNIDISLPVFNPTKNSGNSVIQRWNDNDHTYRVMTQLIGTENNSINLDDRYTISVAVTIDSHQQFLDDFRYSLWLMIFSGILVTGIMAWFAVRQGHSPLHQIVARIQQISGHDLNTRLSPESVPRELIDLAVAFNEMLERVEQAFNRLSNFSADIAHELRTPVTSLMTQTQVALSKSRNSSEYREILYSNIEEYERMAQMIGDMLFLAKADSGLCQLDTEDINLNKEIQNLFEYYEAWTEERGVSLILAGSATAPGDRSLMRRALSNLLSNAIKHTQSGAVVRVLLQQTSEQQITITVENPGPAIPCEHLPKLFDRFYRVDASRQRDGEGVGLGLAITKSIIDIHGGTIDSSSTQGCTRFQITIPKKTEY